MLSGSVDGAGVIALFTTPAGIAVDTTGVIYLIDSNVIRRISVAGLIVLTWYYFWYRINSLFMFVIIYRCCNSLGWWWYCYWIRWW